MSNKETAMSVRAKFRVLRVEITQISTRTPGKDEYHATEMRTIILNPVYSSNPESENAKFFASTPNGEIRLGTINPNAWSYFQIDKEYYIDFTACE
jgi:hypothetical protein